MTDAKDPGLGPFELYLATAERSATGVLRNCLDVECEQRDGPSLMLPLGGQGHAGCRRRA